MKSYVALQDISIDNEKGGFYWIPTGTVYFPEKQIKLKKGDLKSFSEEEFLYVERMSKRVQNSEVQIIDIPDAMVQLLLDQKQQVVEGETKFGQLRADLYDLIRNSLDGIL